MRHRNCGGPIYESAIVYYEDPDYPGEKHPAYYCGKCYTEVAGDDDIEEEPNVPMTFTDEVVMDRLEGNELSTEGTIQERRDRLAAYVEVKYEDYMEAWEIRTGRPWTNMTRAEALELVKTRPQLLRNPGFLSRLAGG